MQALEADLSASEEVVVRLRVLVADKMPQLEAHAGGSEARLLLLCRQLADRFTRMKPVNAKRVDIIGHQCLT